MVRVLTEFLPSSAISLLISDKMKSVSRVVCQVAGGCAHVYLKLTDVCVELRAQWIRHQCRVFQRGRCQKRRRCSMRPARSRIRSWISRIRVSRRSRRCQDCVSLPYLRGSRSIRQIRQLVLTGFWSGWKSEVAICCLSTLWACPRMRGRGLWKIIL